MSLRLTGSDIPKENTVLLDGLKDSIRFYFLLNKVEMATLTNPRAVCRWFLQQKSVPTFASLLTLRRGEWSQWNVVNRQMKPEWARFLNYSSQMQVSYIHTYMPCTCVYICIGTPSFNPLKGRKKIFPCTWSIISQNQSMLEMWASTWKRRHWQQQLGMVAQAYNPGI